MNQLLFKKWYLIVSFFLSIFILIVTILGFTPLPNHILDPLEDIAHYILWLFVIELIVVFIKTNNYKTFFKEQWISIIAVFSSISVTFLVDTVVGIGSLTGLKALKGMKAIKSVKGIKLFKVTKSAKVAKSVKLGKKAKKATKKFDHARQFKS